MNEAMISRILTKILTKIAVVLLLSIFICNSVDALNNEKQVTPSRISHPAYSMSNTGNTWSSPFNVDNTRIIMNEFANCLTVTGYGTECVLHPQFPNMDLFGANGRRLIWGDIATLKSFDFDNLEGTNAGLQDWYDNTYDIPKVYDQLALRGYYSVVWWSPFSGDTSLIYAINRDTNWLVTYDVDTKTETPIISIGNNDYAEILGFNRAKTEIFVMKNYQESEGGSRYWGDAWRITLNRQGGGSFLSPTKVTYAIPESCDQDYIDGIAPPTHLIHQAHSPDGKWVAQYHASGATSGTATNDTNGAGCGTDPKDGDWSSTGGSSGFPIHKDSVGGGAPYYLTHVSWAADDAWYVAGNLVGVKENGGVKASAPDNNAVQEIVQINYNRTTKTFDHDLLVSRASATYWEYGPLYVNYSGLPSPTISADGTFLMFQGTNGKYSRSDKIARSGIIGDQWEGIGVYVAELSPPSGSLACTSFTYSTWSQCQPGDIQTRTIVSSSPAGCTEGNPVLSQTCVTEDIPSPPTGFWAVQK